MKDTVSNKIRLLKDIQPNPDWLKSQRSNLLLKISESGKSRTMRERLPVFSFSQLAFKPVLAVLLFICVVLGGGTITLYAAKNSVSGDLLYPIKISLENAQFTISSQKAKSKLQAEFVANRIQELNKILAETENLAENKERVTKAVDKLQSQIISTQVYLDKVTEVEAVDAISEETVQSEKALMDVKEKLVEELNTEESQEMVQAIDAALKETSILAADLKETKQGIEIQMNVKEGDPDVEEFPSK